MSHNSSRESAIIEIAYADDHVLVRKGISEYINTFDGCRVAFEASNGLELIRLLEQSPTAPSICILDIFMPVMNGLDTLIAVRERWPEIKVLVLTGHETDFYLLRMLRAGANGYLQKSCSPIELENGIRSLYTNGVFASDIATYGFYRSVMRNEVPLPEFTGTEIDVLCHCCSDMSYQQIASRLKITNHSVEWARNSLFKKLKVKSRSSLVMYAMRFGIVPIDIDTTAHSIQIKND